MYFDTHAHLDDKAYEGSLESLVASFEAAGLDFVLTVSADPDSPEKAAEIASRFDCVYAAVGIHPEFAGKTEDGYSDRLERLARSERKVVAIGEIGLDYHYEPCDREAQKRLFREQLGLARRLSLPAIIHSRDAYADTLAVIKEFPDVRKVIHCFSGNFDNARELLAEGCYLSFTGVITFKNAKKFTEILRMLPPDRFFFETDSPYLSPEPLRGTVNNPLNVRYTVAFAAETIGTDTDGLAARTTQNARNFFGI